MGRHGSKFTNRKYHKRNENQIIISWNLSVSKSKFLWLTVFCFTKGSPFGYLTSSGGYWKKQIVKTGCFALRKSREAKQWIAAKLCVMKQQGNKKGDKKEKA